MGCSLTGCMKLMKNFGFARRRLQRDERGATALEFAILTPVFLVMLFAVLQVSIAFHKGNTAQWAVKKAARQVLLDDSMTESQVQALVDSNLDAIGESLRLHVHYTVDTSGSVPIGRIRATYVHKVSVPALTTFYARFPIDVVVPKAPI